MQGKAIPPSRNPGILQAQDRMDIVSGVLYLRCSEAIFSNQKEKMGSTWIVKSKAEGITPSVFADRKTKVKHPIK